MTEKDLLEVMKEYAHLRAQRRQLTEEFRLTLAPVQERIKKIEALLDGAAECGSCRSRAPGQDALGEVVSGTVH